MDKVPPFDPSISGQTKAETKYLFLNSDTCWGQRGIATPIGRTGRHRNARLQEPYNRSLQLSPALCLQI